MKSADVHKVCNVQIPNVTDGGSVNRASSPGTHLWTEISIYSPIYLFGALICSLYNHLLYNLNRELFAYDISVCSGSERYSW